MIMEIGYLILGSIVFLFLFYQILQWRTNVKLKKMQEAYKPEDDTSRYKDRINRGTTEAGINPALQREPSIKGNSESQGRELLPDAVDSTTSDIERDFVESKPKRKRSFKLFGRKTEEVKVEPQDTL